MYDVVISGGRIVDGTGAPWFRGDVGLIDDRIVGIGNLESVEAITRLEAVGQVVAPGFVDFHSHSDVSLLADPRAC
jgi:N-acyl-D-aspartate/D-glutamate deacylase